MRVETVLEQLFFTTTYIGTDNPGGSGGTGTGFVYRVETSATQHALFLVTNKHVIEGASVARIRVLAATDATASAPELGKVHTVTLDQPERVFTGHRDPEVDVAVLPFSGSVNALMGTHEFVFIRAITSDLTMNEETVAELDALEDVTFIGYPGGTVRLSQLSTNCASRYCRYASGSRLRE
jgi:hypothetical protein